ncbi:TraX family protein [Streptococcus sp. NLN64]|uniref:TraX family protein n=1 Tax=Streptococcus sp. NLN64 TaxID=2822799 RepID=UPI0018C8F596|nr:TraX family protein [Streptococcus sp. NLN64]MBG9367482.1 hypothetical protein [Streptococcus sp. NLN64]
MSKIQLTGFQLKIIALIGMFIDHIYTHFGDLLGLPFWVSWIGRFVAPVFLFLLMEGFRYTSNRKAYFLRLLSGAGLMLVINVLHNWLIGNYLDPLTREFDLWMLMNGNNIFLTLACFFLIFTLVEQIKEGNSGCWLKILYLLPLLFFTLLTEGGLYLMPLGLVLAFFPGSKRAANVVLLGTSLALAFKAFLSYQGMSEFYPDLGSYLAYDNQFMQWLAIPLIAAYNGQRGGQGKIWEKNLFYIAYPLHLTLIYVIESLVR